LKQLANEYAKNRRTDDQAVRVYEQLAANPACELRWLRTLAMIYVIRQEWGKLRNLAARLEFQGNQKS
jgi:lipopolysaccharide biosynthesis regulator YciM